MPAPFELADVAVMLASAVLGVALSQLPRHWFWAVLAAAALVAALAITAEAW